MMILVFYVIGNFVSITSKTLREDRTAADKKHVAYCDPPQAENLVNEILFYSLKILIIKRGTMFDFADDFLTENPEHGNDNVNGCGKTHNGADQSK